MMWVVGFPFKAKFVLLGKVLFDHEMYFTRSIESEVIQKNISCTKYFFLALQVLLSQILHLLQNLTFFDYLSFIKISVKYSIFQNLSNSV